MPLSTSELATLSGLLERGLDLPADERASWLDSLPDEHSSLQPMLKQLLARADAPETDDLLHTLPKIDRGRALSDADHGAGERVGPYELLRPLGHGGMGTVWLAERADGALTRQVALKLPLMAAQPLMRQRLARERDILAGLEHPHIARLYDAGIDASGQPYLALEYVDGQPIDAYCKTKAPDLQARLDLFLQVASAVAYAHAHLVLHRDLKPSNILVTADGQVRLLDFGIARLLEEDAAQDSDLTQQAGRALTPDYASPEQILGQPMTVASDVYGLGIVLYEMLTGQRPYRLQRDSHGSLREAIAAAHIAPPSSVVADPRTRRRLAGDLDTIVLKALKKEAAERYPTVNALIEDLERMRAGLPIVARPDSMGYRLRKLVARNRIAVAAAATVLLAVLAGAGVALWQARAAAVERDRALALLDRNQTALDFIDVMISEAVPADEKVTRTEMLARSERIANRMFAANPEQLATVLSLLASHYASTSDYLKSSALLERAVALVRASSDLTLRADIECNHALTLSHVGKAEAARKILSSWLARGELDPASAAQCQLYLVQIAWSTNDAKSALENALGAQARLAKMARPPPLLEASML
ncbi:MAG: serine/threonine-protein kinase, partial [Caldimonas sp.]